ncbi:MAG: transposase [Magnetococcales bacterium]|nr:transposase [Magnetococcales bacterium]
MLPITRHQGRHAVPNRGEGWTQQLIYHPHVHCLVTGGGLQEENEAWHPARKNFLIPVKVLSRLIRGKVMDTLKKVRPDLCLPTSAWTREWVVYATHWVQGEKAVLEYLLARYAFRIAITNCRIIKLDDDTVTFRYKDRKRNRWRSCAVTGEEFMRRFLQHVLPKGSHKVRYGGLWHHPRRRLVARIRLLLQLEKPPSIKPPENDAGDQKPPKDPMKCTHCGKGHLILIRRIERKRAMAP